MIFECFDLENVRIVLENDDHLEGLQEFDGKLWTMRKPRSWRKVMKSMKFHRKWSEIDGKS